MLGRPCSAATCRSQQTPIPSVRIGSTEMFSLLQALKTVVPSWFFTVKPHHVCPFAKPPASTDKENKEFSWASTLTEA